MVDLSKLKFIEDFKPDEKNPTVIRSMADQVRDLKREESLEKLRASNPDFPPATLEAMARLDQEEIEYVVCSAHDLKVGTWHYFPRKGTVLNKSETKSRDTRGIDYFVEMVKNL